MMGQQDIIEFLRSRRLAGDDSYFGIHEIAKGVNGGSSHYSAVRKSLYALVRMRIVDTKAEGDLFDWIRTFRLSSKYVKEC